MSRSGRFLSFASGAILSPMSYSFLDIFATPGVRAAQAAQGVAEQWANFSGHREFTRFTPDETAFIAARDSFYMATVAENGWPYVQHRGGPPGFVKVIDERTLAFPDFRGNRQYISVGNVGASDRVAMILVDYPHRARLKILGHAQIVDLAGEPELAAKLDLHGYKAKVERAFRIQLEAFDWNCPQHITPRFTEAEVASALEPIRQKLAELEKENRQLRAAALAP
jgi:predicted pyridoxine 5'-phosphate oxidase superfamily flavin-nucleotide-binding protein